MRNTLAIRRHQTGARQNGQRVEMMPENFIPVKNADGGDWYVWDLGNLRKLKAFVPTPLGSGNSVSIFCDGRLSAGLTVDWVDRTWQKDIAEFVLDWWTDTQTEPRKFAGAELYRLLRAIELQTDLAGSTPTTLTLRAKTKANGDFYYLWGQFGAPGVDSGEDIGEVGVTLQFDSISMSDKSRPLIELLHSAMNVPLDIAVVEQIVVGFVGHLIKKRDEEVRLRATG